MLVGGPTLGGGGGVAELLPSSGASSLSRRWKRIRRYMQLALRNIGIKELYKSVSLMNYISLHIEIQIYVFEQTNS